MLDYGDGWRTLRYVCSALCALALLVGMSEVAHAQQGMCGRLQDWLGTHKWAHLESAGGGGVPGASDICWYVVHNAHDMGVPAHIAVAVAYAESGLRWVPGASDSYFRGPMQVGAPWCWFQSRRGHKVLDKKGGCIRAGLYWLADWHKKTGSWRAALWGYVGGLKADLDPLLKARKRAYVDKVLEVASRIE